MAAQASSSVQPRAIGASTPVARIRWDRLGRAAMLCLLVALAYLYLSAGIRMYSTWRQAHGENAQLAKLEHEHVRLLRAHEALGRRGTVEEEARRLDMMHAGEQAYVVTGLQRN